MSIYLQDQSAVGIQLSDANASLIVPPTTASLDSVNSGSPVLDGAIGVGFTYSDFDGAISVVKLKATDGASLNYEIDLPTFTDNLNGTGTVLWQDIAFAIDANSVAGVPFSSATFSHVLEVTGITDVAELAVVYNPKVGFTKVDAVSATGYWYEGFTGSVLDNDQLYYESLDNTVITASGEYTSDSADNTTFNSIIFDQDEAGINWKRHSVLVNPVVADVTIPVITLTGSSTVNYTVGDTYNELGATASDNIDGDITGSIIIDAAAINMSAASSYSVTYNVADAAGNNATQVVRTVVVSLPLAPPVMPAGTSDNVTEGNTAVGTYVASSGTGITYALSGTDAADFNINASTAVVTLKVPADFETKTIYSIIVVATNIDGSDSQVVTVNVVNVEEEAILDSGNITIEFPNGNAGLPHNDSTLVAWLAGFTSTNAVTNNLSGYADPLPANIYSVTFQSSDAPDLIKTLTVNEAAAVVTPPTMPSNDSVGILENTTAVGTYAASAGDPTISYTLEGVDAADFNIVIGTGVITFKVAPNYEAKPQYNIDIRATNSAGNDVMSLVVNVVDVDEGGPELVEETNPISAGLNVSVELVPSS